MTPWISIHCVQDYWFREDGYKLWHILEEYVSDIVDLHYKLDVQVAADPGGREFFNKSFVFFL